MSYQGEMGFTVEEWTDDGLRVREILACSSNALVARGAWAAAVELRPGRRILLRNRAHVIADSERAGS